MEEQYCPLCDKMISKNCCEIMSADMQEIVKLILDNANNIDFNVDALCDIMQRNRSNLWEKFTDSFGIPIKKMIENRKLDKALLLIADSEEKLSTICKQCGYAYQTFRKAFKNRIGISPKKFREQIDQKNKEQILIKYRTQLWQDVYEPYRGIFMNMKH